MADVNGNEEACIDIFPQNNDSTGNVECGALASQDVNSSIIDPMIVQSEKKEDGMKDVKIRDNVNENSKEKVKMRKKSEKNITLGGTSNEVVEVAKEQKSSKKMASKKMEGSGMIFMCNSKTKKDCYRYKVLGLPASKKDIVLKIYKGMRLFLFDFELKLMYGIYKAVRPGGYNIEPRAFNSAYPSQVRYTVLEDCLPLAEEKFKAVIKDNYYTRNKFNCQLTSEQVKKLCKLFHAASKGPKPKSTWRGTNAENRALAKYPESERISSAENHALVKYPQARRVSRGSISARTGTLVDRDGISIRNWEEDRQRPYNEEPVIYEMEAFASPGVPLPRRLTPAPNVPRAPPPLPLVYSYDRPLGVDLYEQDRPLLEDHGLRILDHGRRFQDKIEHSDPHHLYREPPLYQERVYPAAVPIEYRHPRSPSPEFHPLRSSYGYSYRY